MADEIRHRVVVEGADAAKRDYEELADAVEKPEQSTRRYNEAATEMFRLEGKLGAALQKLGPEAVAVGAAIGAVAVGAAAAAAAAAVLAAALVRLGQAGSESEQATRVFDRIAGPDTARRLNEATGGMVRATAAQHAYGRAARSGIASADLLRYFELTATAAREMGDDVTEATTRAGEALAGMSGDEARSRLYSLERSFGDLEPRLRSVGEAWDTVANNAGDCFDRLSEGFATTPELIRQLGALGVAIDDNGVAWEQYGAAIGRGSARLLEAGRVFLSLVNVSPIQGVVSAFGVLAGEGEVVPPPPPVGGDAEFVGLGGRGSGMGAGLSAGERTAEYFRTHRAPGRTGGGERREDARAYYEQLTTDLIDSIREEYAARKEASDSALADVTALHDAQMSALEEEAARWQEMKAGQEETERSLHEAALERSEQQRDAEDKLREAQRRRYQTSIENIGAMGEFAAGVGQIFGDIAAQQEAQGKNADGWRKAQGTAMGVMYAIKAIAAGAEAVGMFAEQNYVGGALKVVEAAQMGIASGYAFSRLAESGGGGMAAQSSAGSFVAARPDRLSQGEKVAGPTTMNIYALGSGNSEVAEAMSRANYDLARSGRVARVPGRSVGYQG